MMNWDAIQTIAQVAIFVLGVILIPYLRGLRGAIEDTNSEVHALQLQLVELKASMVPATQFNSQLLTMQSAIHEIEMQMAKSGVWRDERTARPRKSV